jgi:glucose-6-phosphate-specific signal transduction histidine kinase
MKFLIAFIVCFVLCYVCISFVIWDINPYTWVRGQRAVLIFIGVPISLCASVLLCEDSKA